MADAVDDRFELERRIGAGGMGVVWRARDRATGARVAVKLIEVPDPTVQARFAREAQLLAALDHPAIVRHVADGIAVTADGPRQFLAMEWIDGDELRARLRGDGLTTSEALALGARLADALAHAHARGVVHRDVKPSNVLLRGGDPAAAVLIDLGIARLAEDDTRLTRTGTTIGTPAYMAPEQIRGDRALDGRTDLYGLGATLFECLTGRPPHHGAQSLAVMAKVLLEDAPRLRALRPELPPALDDLVAALLARDRDARPRAAAAVAEALRALADPSLPPGPRIAPPSEAITGSEARLVCVVLAVLDGATAAAPRDAGALGHAETATAPSAVDGVTAELPVADRIAQLAAAHDVQLERLRGGAWAALLSSAGVATDLVGRGARLALALRDVAPGARVALAVRHAVMGPGVLDELLEAVAARVDAGAAHGAAPDGIAIDAVAADLLDARYDLDDTVDGPVLRGEHAPTDPARKVLGKTTPLVGRDRELRVLEAVVAGWEDEPGPRAALVTGPAGIGKSRLVAALIARLRAACQPGSIDVWVGRGDPLRRGAPYALLAPALLDAIDAAPGAPDDDVRARLAARVEARLAAAAPDDRRRVRDFLGALLSLPPHPDDDEALAAARDNPALLADQIRLAWEELVLAECAHQPIVLVLEDLHWGDAATVKLADGALRAARGLPLLVVALARPEALAQFPGLFAERDLTHVQLHELGARAVERLVDAVLGAGADAATRARIVDYAGGNPLYAEELIRASAGGGGAPATGVPPTVLAMAVARLDALAPDDRRVLRAASVFGDAFPAGGAAHLLGGGGALDVDARLRELADEEWVTAERPGQFRFRHNLLREATYATLPDDDRRAAHRLAAAWLAQGGEHNAAVLAAHLEAGGDDDGARVQHARAAEQALDASDLDDAIVHARAAERLGATGAELGALRRIEGCARFWRGEPVAGHRAAEAACELLPARSDAWWRALDQSAEAALDAGAVEAIQRHAAWVEGALAGAAAPSAPALLAASTVVMQTAIAGDVARARRLMALLEGAVAAHGATAAIAARLAFARATLAVVDGDIDAVLAGVAEAIARHDELGDVRTACLLRGNLAWALTEVGAAEEACAAALDGAARAEAAGIGLAEATCVANHALALWQLRALDEALAVATRAAQLDAGEPSAKGRLYSVRLLTALGRLDEAERLARAVCGELSAVPSERALAHAALAEALLARGHTVEALAAATLAATTLTDLDAIVEGKAMIRLIHAEALLAAGREGEARAVAIAARDRLHARAARIAEPSRRASFLSRVPDHVRLRALAARLEGAPDATRDAAAE